MTNPFRHRAYALTLSSLIAAGCAAPDEPGEVKLFESARARVKLEELPSLSQSAVEFFVVTGDRVRPHLQGSLVKLELPASADGSVELADVRSGLGVSFRLIDARRAPIGVALGLALYEGALPGADLVLRPDATGVEDLLAFEAAAERALVTYRIGLKRVAGLRLISRSLELLDSEGTPRLRVAPPFVLDALGSVYPAELRVLGCSFDTDPAPPWGRTPTPPGAAGCELEVDWSGQPVVYPALLDPRWTTTDDLAVARKWAEAAVLGDGRVLVAGGDAPTPTVASELFDPGTSTWASTGNMREARRYFTLVPLGMRALAIGGTSGAGALSSAELFDAGSWTLVGSMGSPRQLHAAARMLDGRVLVAGGLDSASLASSEIYDPTGRAFSPAGPLNASRRQHTLSTLPNGKLLAAGGVSGTSFRGGELYDPVSNQWTPTVPMSVPRQDHRASALYDGRVLVVSGYNGALLSSAEIFDPVSGAWSLTDSSDQPHDVGIAVTLDNGGVLVSGGCATTACASGTTSAELYDVAAGRFFPAPPMSEARVTHVAAKLPDGRVLVGAGLGGGLLASAEIFALSAPGEACSANVECTTGSCTGSRCGSGGTGGTDAGPDGAAGGAGAAGTAGGAGSGGIGGAAGGNGAGGTAGITGGAGEGGAAATAGGAGAAGTVGATATGGAAGQSDASAGGRAGSAAGGMSPDGAIGAVGGSGRATADEELKSLYACTMRPSSAPRSSLQGVILCLLSMLLARRNRRWRKAA